MSPPDVDARSPLAALRVVDIATNIAGSRAAALLAEAGAEVLKIRPQVPVAAESAKTYVGSPPAEGVAWRYANRGKRELDRAQLEEALKSADLLIHDLPMERAGESGLDLETLKSINPRLIVAAVTPFGFDGPRSDWISDDLIAMATSGLMYSTPGFPDYVEDTEAYPPLRPSTDMAELITSVIAAAACLDAVLARGANATSEFVDVSSQEAIASLLAWDYALYNYGGVIAGRRETRAGLSPNALLPCRDGYVVLVAFNQHHWEALVDMMGNPDWADSELFATPSARGENWDALKPLLELWLADHDRFEIMTEAQKRGIPTCAALETQEAFDNAQIRHRRFYVRQDSGRVPGSIFKVNGERVLVSDEPSSEAAESARSGETDHKGDAHRGGLSGVRIIDFGHMVAVPQAAQWLALMGAEVIQVESRFNMVTRQFAPIVGDPPWNTSGFYNHINNNKRSVTLNLRDPRGVELARGLIAKADVVMENYSAGTMEKMGLGYEDLKRIRPDIIMLSISAFGRDGPWAGYNALHSGVLSLSGLAALTGYEGDPPRMCGSILPDVLSSCAAVLGVAQAIYCRRWSGEGQHIELAMSEVVQALLPEPIYELTRYGKARRRGGNQHPHCAPHNVYRTRGDDRWLAISVREEGQWEALCRALDRRGLAVDDRFSSMDARLANVEELDALIAGEVRELDAFEAASRLQSFGVPAGPVQNVEDILNDESLRSRGFVQVVDHPQAGSHPMVGRPWVLHEGGFLELRHAPLLGEGHEDVLGELLGLSQEDIRQLEAEKVVY